jgi:hypothetical protein
LFHSVLTTKPSRKPSRLRLPLIAICAIAGLGCSETVEVTLPPAHPVTGVVTLNAKPVAGAMLQFVPQGNTKGNDCFGVTDESGKYSLKQFRGEDGAQVGEYSVVIELHLKPDGSPLKEDEAPREVMANQVLPKMYSQLASTILRANVPEGGGQFNFDLKDMKKK